MKLKSTNFKGLKIIQSKIYRDSRGFFKEDFKQVNFSKKFIFGCTSRSKKNVLRGLHIQTKNSQGKHISVLKGSIYDVVVDLRKKSKTFGKTFKIILSKENALGLYIPRGFAHAYYSFERENIIYYKLDNYYASKYESGIVYNDDSIKIKWPKKKMLISKKDKKLLTIKEFRKRIKGL